MGIGSNWGRSRWGLAPFKFSALLPCCPTCWAGATFICNGKDGNRATARNWVGSFLVTCYWCTDYRAGSYGFVTVDMRGCKPSLGMSLHRFLLLSSRGSTFWPFDFRSCLALPLLLSFLRLKLHPKNLCWSSLSSGHRVFKNILFNSFSVNGGCTWVAKSCHL